MRSLIVSMMVMGALGNVARADDQIPLLLNVPPVLARMHPELVGRRADLLQQRAALHSSFEQHNSQCSSVVSGSPQDLACLASRNSLTKARSVHIFESKGFNAAVESSEREDIALLCHSLDGEMHEMSTIDIRIVGMQLDALGKLLPVELGIWESAEEPPEDVFGEATNHLQKMTIITEQIDELNGKAAWTKEQREWALRHIYVATSTGNFSVSSSDMTAHGQTDFSSLEKMPTFAGCARDSTGRLYIPQY